MFECSKHDQLGDVIAQAAGYSQVSYQK